MWLSIFFVLSFTSIANSHTFLTKPEPYNRCNAKATLICPRHRLEKPPSKACVNRFTSDNQPAAIWKRGHEYKVRWARNNHNGGFIRLGLVPIARMFDKKAHKNLAFYYGCWEQGEYKCSGAQCGTDSTQGGFQRRIRVPEVLPNGLYVLSLLWYGGVHFKRKKGLFSDFTSCAYVRINGGLNRKFRYQPFFETGNLGVHEHKGQCMTSSRYPGDCLRGCSWAKPFYALPFPFNSGRKPRQLKQSDYLDVEN